ncbi:MAG: hypothetical protein EPN23_10855 [Verrucomicrobia bacterium]|nr:MAG: hypothetical protein EPN23_10855 [Verrucomicrobiota bacterium]
MKSEEQLHQLLAAARAAPVDTAAVEFGFETRLLARLRDERNRGAAWGLWSWRLAPALAALVLLLAAWTWWAPNNTETDFTQGVSIASTEQTLAAHWTGSATP